MLKGYSSQKIAPWNNSPGKLFAWISIAVINRRNAPMTTNQKNCIACGGELKSGASLCQSCGSSQSFWRNELRYWAAVAGVFSIVAATIGYSINAGPEIRKTLFWNDSIKILRFSESEDETALSVVNTGDGPVWIEKLTYQAGGSFKQNIDVARTIEVNGVLNENLEPGKLGQAGCYSPFAVDKDHFAGRINKATKDDSSFVHFTTNPNSELIEEGYGIPGTVTVQYLSLKTNDFHTAKKDLFAILNEYYDCE